MLITQNKCEVCESLKDELPQEDIGIEVINLSTDENAFQISKEYNIEKVPILVCDCGGKEIDRLRGEQNIREFIQEIT